MSKDELKLSRVRSIDVVASTAPNFSHFGDSFKVLFRWKNSIYKLVWKHMLIYFCIYISLSILYELILDEEYRVQFRAVAQYCSQHTGSINLMIMLGFFTSTAMQRLFTIQTNMPGTAKSMVLFMSSLKSDLPEGPAIVEQYSRWQVLAWMLTFRAVSRPLHDKYPDLESLQAAGLLKNKERQILEFEEVSGRSSSRPLIVINWMLLLLKETLLQGRFFNEFNYLKNVESLMAYKKSSGNVMKFAAQNMPYSIIQAVVMSVYCFGMTTLVARNFKDNTDPAAGIFLNYIPILPGIQFFIYFAWLCLGREAVNPFGDDDDDINVVALAQSHIENFLRLQKNYTTNLGDVFPELPQMDFNDNVRL